MSFDGDGKDEAYLYTYARAYIQLMKKSRRNALAWASKPLQYVHINAIFANKRPILCALRNPVDESDAAER